MHKEKQWLLKHIAHLLLHNVPHAIHHRPNTKHIIVKARNHWDSLMRCVGGWGSVCRKTNEWARARRLGPSEVWVFQQGIWLVAGTPCWECSLPGGQAAGRVMTEELVFDRLNVCCNSKWTQNLRTIAESLRLDNIDTTKNKKKRGQIGVSDQTAKIPLAVFVIQRTIAMFFSSFNSTEIGHCLGMMLLDSLQCSCIRQTFLLKTACVNSHA